MVQIWQIVVVHLYVVEELLEQCCQFPSDGVMQMPVSTPIPEMLMRNVAN